MVARRRPCAAALLLALALAVTPRAQQAPARECPDCGPSGVLPAEPQIFHTGEQSFRVVPAQGLSRPWALAFLLNGDILITERAGRLRIVRGGLLDPEPLDGVPSIHHPGRQGLMDVALHPDFAANRLVYFTYHTAHPENRLAGTPVLARARFDGRGAVTGWEELFRADAWYVGTHAARILFAPDRTLFMAIGVPARRSIGAAENVQDPSSHAGKVLRLNDDGSAPGDNPFAATPGHLPEIYAFGIRNAIGMAFHPETGELWETENGPQGGDEVNIIRPGRNYGWPIVSYGRSYSGELAGTSSGPQQPRPVASGIEDPFFVWSPSIAPSGTMFYTGDRFPAWKGDLFVGALRGAAIHRLIFNARGLRVGHQSLRWQLRQRIREVRQGPDGLIYLLTDENDGALLRIEPV